jgi:hypothetical protein
VLDVDGESLLSQPELVARVEVGGALGHEGRFERNHQGVDGERACGSMRRAPSPSAESEQDRVQLATPIRELVESSSRAPVLHDAARLQLAEPLREHVRACSERDPEIAESLWSEQELANDEQRPAFPDDVEPSGWNSLDEGKRKQREASGVKAWMDWAQANSAAIVDQGSPLGKTKRASPEGLTDLKNAMVAYVIVQAESHDAAAKLFENHPHFTIFPGDSVEIMECLPFPAQ